MKKVLAIDIGASSGRAILGTYKDGAVSMHEIHRFSNEPVRVLGHVHWDILRLFHEVKVAIKKAGDIDSIGIDTWGVDYGLINSGGRLRGNPYHYRDERNSNAEKLDIYKNTGIQFMQFNTVYQLAHEKLHGVQKVLLIPDLLAYFLTGEMRMEYTNASTTNLLNAYTHELDDEVLSSISVDKSLFAKMIKPGEMYGMLSDDICKELDIRSVPVIAVGTHDTASAVASIPANCDEDFVYISSGTWSLFGTLSDTPLVNEMSERLNFTNELAIDFRTRLLKNVMGLWLMQEVRREYNTTFTALSDAAKSAKPFANIIDPDSDEFLGMGNMIKRIERAVGKELTMPEVARCIYDSLALKYRFTLENLKALTGKNYNVLYMFGGGIKDDFLCQLTADACGISVITCSSEATALGNIAVQVTDKTEDIPDIMRKSIETKNYQPTDREKWEKAYQKHHLIFKS